MKLNFKIQQNLKKKTEDLLSQVNNVKMIKCEIFNQFEEYTKIIKKENSKVLKSLTEYKEELYNIKKKYMEISNHMKYKNDIKNINFNLKSAFNKNRKKNLKPNNGVDAINILKINKIEFDHDFDEIKRKEERRMSLNFSSKKEDKIGDLSLYNNNFLNTLFDFNNNKNKISKSVIKQFKLNKSNYSSKSNNSSIIKDEGDNNNIYSKREKSVQSEYNKSITKEQKLIKNIVNKNKKEDINDV